MSHRMGALHGANDPLRPGDILKGVLRLVVGDRHILRPADIVEMGVFRSDARIIQPCGDGIHRSDLPVCILTEIGFHAVEYPQAPGTLKTQGLS